MEDSRNIIKAIDALTLKAGGEVVDSKNITEAIDNLKAVFDQQAIGIDDTLTQEGLAADAKAAGDAINTANSRIVGMYNTYNSIGANESISYYVDGTRSDAIAIVTKNGSGGGAILHMSKDNAGVYRVTQISGASMSTNTSENGITINCGKYSAVTVIGNLRWKVIQSL